jgi:diaminopimelate epimerase
MELNFYKYQGTGNDFVMIDNRTLFFEKTNVDLVAKLCNRRFGIGADGLILLENDTESDFKMVYYNADGNESTMCGNGGRCIVAFAKQLGIFSNTTTFNAIDGLHHAYIDDLGIVSLQMIDVTNIDLQQAYSFLNTGSPHHVALVDDLQNYNVKSEGAAIRYGNLYGKEGSNVNFTEKISDNSFAVRTYERGVEDETLACGTGATAVAIAMHATQQTLATEIAIKVQGGLLNISFDVKDSQYQNVFLKGPAVFVFQGTILI